VNVAIDALAATVFMNARNSSDLHR
jgi:hypothetical protein